MKLAGVVILFNPNEDVLQNILTYKNSVKSLYVIDNSEQFNNNLQKLVDRNNGFLYYKHDGINEGISKRLNQAAQKAIDEGYEWLLTMDQDSYFDQETINYYLQEVSNYKYLNEVAMFGIEHDEKMVSTSGDSFINASLLITSGSIVNLNIYKRIGGFDDNLFIDHVDHEYCLRALLKGYKIAKWNKNLLHHTLGEKSNHRSLKNLKLTQRSLHTPLRLYYMVRNYNYLKSKYKKYFKKEIKILSQSMLNEIKNNIFYNKKRFKVLRFIIKGFLDFRKGEMGKINLF
jgi:rhamnosyltransferase